MKTKSKTNLKEPAVPCGCRLCQYKLTGSYNSMEGNRTPQKLPLKRPRNPMNHRTYGGPTKGSSITTSMGNMAAGMAAGAMMNAVRI